MISFFHIYYLLPAAAKEKKGVCGDTPHPGKGLCPLHSCFVRCLRRRKRSGILGYPSPSKEQCPLCFCNLCFFEGAGYFAEREFISVVDWCCFIWLQALAVDACGVCAVQISDCKGAANVINGGVYA